jgi:hypothetical protein
VDCQEFCETDHVQDGHVAPSAPIHVSRRISVFIPKEFRAGLLTDHKVVAEIPQDTIEALLRAFFNGDRRGGFDPIFLFRFHFHLSSGLSSKIRGQAPKIALFGPSA